MSKPRKTKQNKIPPSAVLLIPEPEARNASPAYGIRPGYYSSKQMLQLIGRHKDNPNAIHFIADMLETGDAANDAFAVMLKTNCANPVALKKIIQECSAAHEAS